MSYWVTLLMTFSGSTTVKTPAARGRVQNVSTTLVESRGFERTPVTHLELVLVNVVKLSRLKVGGPNVRQLEPDGDPAATSRAAPGRGVIASDGPFP
jgi:hypothetical protein